METNPAVAPTRAIPSSTFSTNVVNAVLCMFLESCATIEDIANQNNLSIPTVMQCLEEQKPFLRNMLSTLELRVRLLASRAEAVAIETLREISHFARDPEARRKSASKLLSHFKRPVPPSPRFDGEKVPSPQGEGDEGRLARATAARSQTHAAPPTSHEPAPTSPSQKQTTPASAGVVENQTEINRLRPSP